MTFEVNGVEVGVYDRPNSTTAEVVDFGDTKPNSIGLQNDLGMNVNDGTFTTYVGALNASDGISLLIWHIKGLNTTLREAQIRCVDLAANVQSTGYVFIEGQGIETGTHGTHDYTFSDGSKVNDDGDSPIVFEDGTGLSLSNVETSHEDDPENFSDPNPANNDTYAIEGNDAVSRNLFDGDSGDSVGWYISGGSYRFTVQMEQLDDGRSDESDGFPDRWCGVGPSGSVDGGAAGPGTSVTVAVDI